MVKIIIDRYFQVAIPDTMTIYLHGLRLSDYFKIVVGLPGEETATPASASLFLTLRVRNPCLLALRMVSKKSLSRPYHQMKHY